MSNAPDNESVQSLRTGNWGKTNVGEFAPFQYGKSLPARKRVQSGQVPVFGSNGIVGYHNKALTKGPTVVIGRKGSAGAVHYSPGPCWPIDTTFYLHKTESELMRFRYYALRALGLDKMNTDSAVPGLNRIAAHQRELMVPDECTQRAIARVLGSLDDKIELNRRMAETLEEMTRALFKSWLVDFDPVRAKMEGRWQEGESLPGLPADLYPLFPDRLVDSELGPIPEGWLVKSLDQIADFTNGLALQRFPPVGDEWLPVIKIAEMRRGYTDKTGKASASIDPQYIVEDGDVLFSWSGSLELVLWANGPGALNQHLLRLPQTITRVGSTGVGLVSILRLFEPSLLARQLRWVTFGGSTFGTQRLLCRHRMSSRLPMRCFPDSFVNGLSALLRIAAWLICAMLCFLS